MKTRISPGDYGAHFPREASIKLPEIASERDKRRDKKFSHGLAKAGGARKIQDAVMSHTDVHSSSSGRLQFFM
ncbi:hypothetical protein E2C01_056464 [Portunus trituberculatus]|uniref:Uncharacterized protein n=1 Tax=Portunus trituberculatus TaxID=210409 RepID=A0A5B7GXR9_PORTR|nr:hypothetical protein [Portunus trituberculatus]